MSSLVERWAERIADDAARSYLHSAEFRSQVGKHARWAIQDYEPGYGLKERQAFTETVALRIYNKARDPVYLFGFRIWRKRPPLSFCATEAELIVTEFLRGDKIKFGDQRFDWTEGSELADADMEYWEACP